MEPISQACVGDHFQPLSENFLIGADTSILEFIKSAEATNLVDC